MQKSDTPVAESRKKVTAFFLWTFAAVGFLAALIQVLSFFTPSGSQLQIRVIPNETAIQKVIYEALNDTGSRRGFAAKRIAEEREFFCSANSQRGGKVQGEASILCKDYEAIEALFKLISRNNGVNSYFDYEISNVGTSVAKEMRLSGEDILLVELGQRGNKMRQIKETEDRFYSLPDLNPAEQIEVRVWSDEFRVDPRSAYLSVDSLPRVTFEGGTPSVSVYKLAPSLYADVHDLFDGMPLAISILFVMALCTAVGMCVIIAFSVVSAVIAGDPVGKIFQQAKQAEPALSHARVTSPDP